MYAQTNDADRDEGLVSGRITDGRLDSIGAWRRSETCHAG
jgi:hypothetical protein